MGYLVTIKFKIIIAFKLRKIATIFKKDIRKK